MGRLEWGSSALLTPEYRRGYVEVLMALEDIREEDKRGIPTQVMDFMEEHKDPDYVFEPKLNDHGTFDNMSWQGIMVMEMIMRYFHFTKEEREEYDQSQINAQRSKLLEKQEYIQKRVDGYIRMCEVRGFPFHGMDPAKLKSYSVGCTQTLAVLDKLIPQYVKRLPKEYIWILEMSRKKGYQYNFELEYYDDMCFEKEAFAEETLEILSDISYRYWKGFQVPLEEIEVELDVIVWKG